MKQRIIVIPDQKVEIDYDAIPESARQDLLRVIYKEVLEARKQPGYWEEFEAWKAKRKAVLHEST